MNSENQIWEPNLELVTGSFFTGMSKARRVLRDRVFEASLKGNPFFNGPLLQEEMRIYHKHKAKQIFYFICFKYLEAIKFFFLIFKCRNCDCEL